MSSLADRRISPSPPCGVAHPQTANHQGKSPVSQTRPRPWHATCWPGGSTMLATELSRIRIWVSGTF
jgi:hypothetical protein